MKLIPLIPLTFFIPSPYFTEDFLFILQGAFMQSRLIVDAQKESLLSTHKVLRNTYFFTGINNGFFQRLLRLFQ